MVAQDSTNASISRQRVLSFQAILILQAFDAFPSLIGQEEGHIATYGSTSCSATNASSISSGSTSRTTDECFIERFFLPQLGRPMESDGSHVVARHLAGKPSLQTTNQETRLAATHGATHSRDFHPSSYTAS
jgi:hypothetical protein